MVKNPAYLTRLQIHVYVIKLHVSIGFSNAS